MDKPLYRAVPQPPPLYVEFIATAKEYAAKAGLSWHISLDESGVPVVGQDWDLRRLMATRERHAAHFGSFAYDSVARLAVAKDGYNRFPIVGCIFDSDSQDFFKAMAVAWAKKGHKARQVRDYLKNLRTIFSVVPCKPWELASEHLAFVSRICPAGSLQKHIRRLGTFFNSEGLSLHLPISVSVQTQETPELLRRLSDRKAAWKLPDRTAMYELFRIVTQEEPRSHIDAIRFAATRVLFLTGLRLEEVEWLPADCLVWTRHEDFLTGRPAGDVGGVTWTLRLRYFSVKRSKGRRDLLVEESQPIPDAFVDLLAETIGWMREATEGLRHTLARQRLNGDISSRSSMKRFRTTMNDWVGFEDLLFLMIKGSSDQLTEIPIDAEISLISRNALYDFLGVNGWGKAKSAFHRYGRLAPEEVQAIRPHSLRHLLDAEYFRQEVANTTISKQFGRDSVTQSHVYEHDSLAEKLKKISLPPEAYGSLIPGSMAELIGKAIVSGADQTSHVAISFRKIQSAQGDAAAFAYLAANVDGFHKTPYGFCLNSFAINPCPKHLQCFNNCRHFAPSGEAKHTVKLSALREELKRVRVAASNKPVNTVGRKNQLADIDSKIKGVEMALLGAPGLVIFPDGKDLSEPQKDVFS